MNEWMPLKRYFLVSCQEKGLENKVWFFSESLILFCLSLGKKTNLSILAKNVESLKLDFGSSILWLSKYLFHCIIRKSLAYSLKYLNQKLVILHCFKT